jgi:hypothetical protein
LGPKISYSFLNPKPKLQSHQNFFYKFVDKYVFKICPTSRMIFDAWAMEGYDQTYVAFKHIGPIFKKN